MAAIPILAFLEFLEVGSTAAAFFETWLSTETAAALASAGTNAIATEAGKKIDQTLYDKFLEQIPEDVKNAPEDFQKNFWLLEGFLRTNDPTKVLETERQKQKTEQASGPVEFKYSALDGSQPGQGLVILPRPKTEAQIEVEKVIEQASRTEEIIQNFRAPVVPPVTRPNVYDSQQLGPRDLARLLIDSSRELVKTLNPIKATLTVLETNTQLFSLTQKVTSFLASKSLPDNEEYKQIAAVYNGRNIDFSSFSIATNPRTRLIEVTGVDETGTPFTLPQTVGVVLPSVPGTVFMGPLSRNDELPTEGRVEDYFSFHHDYSWSIGGNFDRVGDLKFISRLSNNLDRVRPEHRTLVQSTIIYFSNVSLTLGLLKDQKSDSVEDVGDNDIFSVLGAVDEAEVSPEQYTELKNEFYNVLQEGMVNYQKTDGWFTSYRQNLAETLIDDLEIQLN
ncbi:hypothetical protein BASA81_008359 [Batrachochytrium salamandrivorans]|nr:hypothetical protein BASA81_008359 [Batrachochytrium salamandrivorans]